MKEMFLKYRVVIFRFFGVIMLLAGFVLFFWVTPKEVMTENEIAAANIARVEASVAAGGKSSTKISKPDSSKFMQELKNTQEKQMQYLMIISMIVGVAFLGYSFIAKEKKS